MELPQTATEHFLAAAAVLARGFTVDIHDAEVAIEQGEALLHVAQHVAQPGLALAQATLGQHLGRDFRAGAEQAADGA